VSRHAMQATIDV